MFIKLLLSIYYRKRLSRFLLLIFIIFSSCTDIFVALEEDEGPDSSASYIFEIEPRLPIDNNGYYHLTLNRSSWQTIHRVSGNVSDKEGFPVFYYWVEWQSDLYWYIGDTLGYIINRHLNDSGIYVSVDTSYIIGFNGMEVPTSNHISYSNSNGEINNMIAPVRSMIGDTMKLSYNTSDTQDHIYIVLD